MTTVAFTVGKVPETDLYIRGCARNARFARRDVGEPCRLNVSYFFWLVNTREVGEEKESELMKNEPRIKMAGSTGLEPAASGVTGRRYNRLNYDPACTTSYSLKEKTDRKMLFRHMLVGETGIEPVTSSL
jgi:hypothetical protein